MSLWSLCFSQYTDVAHVEKMMCKYISRPMDTLKTIAAMMGVYKPEEEKAPPPLPMSPWQVFQAIIHSSQPTEKIARNIQHFARTQLKMLTAQVHTTVQSVQEIIEVHALSAEGNGSRAFGDVYIKICQYLWSRYNDLRVDLNDAVLYLVVQALRERCGPMAFDACIALRWEDTRLAALRRHALPISTCGSDMTVKFRRDRGAGGGITCSTPQTIYQGHLTIEPHQAFQYFSDGNDILPETTAHDFDIRPDTTAFDLDEFGAQDAGSLLYPGGRKSAKRLQTPTSRKKSSVRRSVHKARTKR